MIQGGSVRIKGSEGIDVKQDATTGQLQADLLGSEDLPIKQKPITGELEAELLGSEDLPIAQKAVSGELLAELNGSEGLPIKQKAVTGELIAELQGSESLAIKQKAITGELQAELLGSTGNPIAQDANDKIISIMQGDNGVGIAQDANNRLEAALYGSLGLVAQDASLRIQAAIYGSNGLIAQDASNRLQAIIMGDNSVAIAQDVNNRLESAMYGDQGVVAQDASNRLMSAMYGSNGLVAQDASNRLQAILMGSESIAIKQKTVTGELIAQMVGSTGNAINQDANDNLVSVMKGDYSGTLKTWKVDTDGRGIMTIADQEDIWGNYNIVGLAEHAVRCGSSVSFDRRGQVYWIDDFENSTLKWTKYSGTGGTGDSATISNNNVYQGDGCLKIVSRDAINGYVQVQKPLGGLAKNKLGFEIVVDRKNDLINRCAIVLTINTSTRLIMAGVSMRQSGLGGLEYLHSNTPNVDASWTLFDDTFTLLNMTYPIKFVVDITTEQYVRCLFGGTEIDMSAYTPYATNSSSMQGIYCNIHVVAKAASNIATYFDNAVITIEEPT